ncbi:S-layer homology domain-containing protein [Paenibacillus sp. PL2-23]|uniref:S-layer homology domain-containing protein n=1 Tax=Paenibacillus sp. PL2-23 TaxID=2100729 RepID=UPI0030F705CA
MKKKVLKVSVAASLAFGTIAGLPLSATGVQQLLGANTAYAVGAPLPAETDAWVQNIVDIYSKLTPAERKDVKDFQEAMEGLQINVSNEDLIEPLVSFLNLEAPVDLTPEEVLNIIKFFGSIASTDDATELSINLNAFRSDSDVRGAVSKVLEGSGIALDGPTAQQIQFSDITAFQDALQTALMNEITMVDALGYILALSTNSLDDKKDEIKEDLKGAFTVVLGDSSLKLSQALAYHASSDLERSQLADAIASSYLNLVDVIDSDMKGQVAIMKALMRSEASLASSAGTTELTPALSVFGHPVGNSLLKWSSNNSLITFSESSNKFVLSGSAPDNTTVTAEVSAHSVLLNELIFKGNITLRRDVFVGNPGNPPASPQPDTNREYNSLKANEAVNKAKEAAQNASPREKAELVQDALKEIKEAISNMSKATTLGNQLVTVVDGKTVPVFKEGNVIEHIKEIKNQVDKLQKEIREVEPRAQVPFEFTLDFGNIEAETVSIPLSGELLTGAKDNGVTKLNVEANGTGVGFSPEQFDGDVTLTIDKVPQDTVSSLSSRSIVSPIVDVSFHSSNGTEINNFATPVDLRLNIPTHPEPDYLSIFKVETDNRLTNYGGMYIDGGVKTQRITLSPYVVLENKVSFEDTASVSTWAGKEISVIAAKGIVQGRGEGQFDPNANVTRAEFAKMLASALGITGGEATETFSDVTEQDWFQPYVAAIQTRGIANGKGDGQFDPHAAITRAEMAAMIARGLQAVRGTQSFVEAEDMLEIFTDEEQIHATLQEGVAFTAEQGIILGMPSGEFAPNKLSTRAQAAVMIYRLLNL